MNKFIRTKNKIFELKANMTIEDGVYCFFGKIYNTPEKHLFRNNKDLGEFVSQSDDLSKLCDIFKNVSVYAGTISFTDYMNFELARFNKSDDAALYGYIYVTLPNGAVRIEPVAKMDDKGDLELI